MTGGNAADKPIWDTEWGWWPYVLDDAATAGGPRFHEL